MYTPRVSVVMPAYNREKYIATAIDSVLMQTFKDFELIIVDDGSTDNTLKIVKQYTDSRIRLIQHEKNKGVAAARNTGYKNSKGEFIVIADSDDINLPKKFEEQVSYLDNNANVDIVGCQYQHFNGIEFLEKWTFEGNNEYIKSMRLFWNHQAPASMFRKDKIRKIGMLYHDESLPAAVDTDWFSKMPKEVTFYNIQKVLYLYRRHENQITKNEKNSIQRKCITIIRKKMIDNTGIDATEREINIHYVLCDYESFVETDISFKEIISWAEKLIQANLQSEFNDINIFTDIVVNKVYDLCVKYSYLGTTVWEAWEEFKYKNRLNLENTVLNQEVVKDKLEDKSIAIWGTLRSATLINLQLKKMGININYFIDNKWTYEINQMDDIPIIKLEMIKESEIDVILLSILGMRNYLLKDYVRNNYPDITVFSIDDLS